MPRRVIDPSIWTNEKFAALPYAARLLTIAMVTIADDQGRGKANPAYLRSAVFTYDDVSISEVQEWIDKIEAHGTILLYESGGKSYYQILNWWDYQDHQFAQPSEYPVPPINWSDRIRRNVGRGSIGTHNWVTRSGERIEDTLDADGKVLETNGKPPASSPASPQTDPGISTPKATPNPPTNAPAGVTSPLSTRVVRLQSPYLDPRRFVSGYIPAGTGQNAVEVYYERFQINNDRERLSAPQEDDLASCTDLERFRAVVTEYSQRPYRERNVKLLLEWYRRGIPDPVSGLFPAPAAQQKSPRVINVPIPQGVRL